MQFLISLGLAVLFLGSFWYSFYKYEHDEAYREYWEKVARIQNRFDDKQ